MASKESTRFNFDFNAAEATKADNTAHVAGLAEALRHATTLGPQVAALHQGLLGGMRRAREREAKRIAARYGDADPRIEQAQQHMQAYERLQAAAKSQLGSVKSVVETLQRDGLFHGTVMLADGQAAAKYTVRLSVQTAANQKAQVLSATTDSDGHFRMELSELKAVAGSFTGAASSKVHWSERLFRSLNLGELHEAAAPATAASAPAPAATVDADTALTSSVQVLDPAGKVVFEDPMPPEFTDGQSEYRYYVVAR